MTNLQTQPVTGQPLTLLTNGVLPINTILKTLNDIYFIYLKESMSYSDAPAEQVMNIDYTVSVINQVLLQLQEVQND